MIQTRQDNDVINHKDVVYVENGTKLSWTVKENVVYVENETELSRSIRHGTVYDVEQTEQ